ncbi:MAG TPA: YceI family protein, partial [Mycobacteriales bacterium]|nr:YceI family protein [Mycobacteriales bacterium]
VHGDLTLHGVTRPVPLRVDYLGHARDPWGADGAVFSATARVDREEFGVSWNAVLETDGVVVSREIEIEIEIETIRQP